MLWNASGIKGYTIAAEDGHVGSVDDLLFDDASWRIRWLVVDTGHWLPGRKVLLPTSTLGHANAARREFSAKLTMQQIKDSPDVDSERPVSRQMETHLYNHYGWNPYWGYGLYIGAYGYTGGMGASPFLDPRLAARRDEDEAEAEEAQRERDDPHLRSIEAVRGYHIHATDGDIGHVEDFLVEEADWSIHYLVIDTRNWWPGKRVLISPHLVRDVGWSGRTIAIDADRQSVRGSPGYDASTTVDRDYENQFYNYYGKVRSYDRPDHPSGPRDGS